MRSPTESTLEPALIVGQSCFVVLAWNSHEHADLDESYAKSDSRYGRYTFSR